MVTVFQSLSEEYWKSFAITREDIEFINNYLFENEIPRTAAELTPLLFEARIQQEKQQFLEKQKKRGKAYSPAEKYNLGDKIVFPLLEWQEGTISSIRPGVNPNIGNFDVLEVEFNGFQTRQFAGNLEDHKLNNIATSDELESDSEYVDLLNLFAPSIEAKLLQALNEDEGLVRIAGRWFPKALLIDISLGHLNLAEAVLDEAQGTPMRTASILNQIDMGGDTNSKLLEFSMNYALQEDVRFDEIGPAGEILWCLERLEPQGVRTIPAQLMYTPMEYDRAALTEEMHELENELDDELSDILLGEDPQKEALVSLTYSHWRAGTLPVSNRVNPHIPYAYESERIRFIMMDKNTNEEIPAWVVRKNRYIFGLKDYYDRCGLIPGSLVSIRKSNKPGIVWIDAKTRRPKKEWVRTVLVGRDGGIVFAMLKQNITADYNERMVAAVPDIEGLDTAREQLAKSRKSFEDSVISVMQDLTKLNLQGHVHAQELYSALNIVMRCPPGPLLTLLATHDEFVHVGDLHFRLNESI